MWRWLLRIGVLLVVVLMLALGAVQYVLWSDYPHQLIVDQLQQATGLRVRLGELETGWSGRTTLHDLQLRLPTDDDEAAPLLSADTLKVRHASLLMIALSGDVGLASIITDAHLNLRQDESGSWNVQRAIGLIASRAESDGSPPAALPKLTIQPAVVNVTTADGTTRTYDNIAFDAEPLAPTAWRLKTSIGEQLVITGRLNPAGDVHHELSLHATDLQTLLSPWVDTKPIAPASADLRLIGSVKNGAYHARIDTAHIHAAEYSAMGVVKLTVADQITIQPAGLRVRGIDPRLGVVRLDGGRVTIDGPVIEAHALDAAARDTTARLDGRWNTLQTRGSLEADWSGRLAERDIDHQGSLRATAHRLTTDQWRLETNLTTHGEAPAGRWRTQAELSAAGNPAGALTWSLTLPRGRFTPADGEPVTLDRLTASGRADVADGTWTADASIAYFHPPGSPRPIDVKLAADGDRDRVTIQNLNVQRNDAALTAEGHYTFADPSPLKLEGTLRYEHAPDDPTRPDVPPWAGKAQWTGTITGIVSPKHEVAARGELAIESLTVNGQTIEPMTITSRARFADGELTLSTDPFDVLDGQCEVSGAYVPETATTQLKLTLTKLALSRLSAVVNPELNVEGLASAQLQVHLPRGLMQRVRAEGDWEVENFQRRTIAFDRMTGRLSTRGRMLRLDPIVLLKDTGRAEGSVLFNLVDGNSLHAELKPQQWPVRFDAAGVNLAVNGDVTLDVDIAEQTVIGALDLQSDLIVEAGNAIGRLGVVGEISETQLTVSEIHGTLAGGSVDGEATVPLADWTGSTALLTLQSIDPAALSGWQPALGRLSGRLDATVKAAPAENPRAPEPLRVDVEFAPVDQSLVVQRLPFGAGSATTYVGPKRLMIDESEIALAQGKVKLWASFSPHVDQWYNHLRITLENLNTNVLAQSLRAEPGEPVPGKLSGHANAIGPVGDWSTLVGRGELTLDDSNFVNTDLLGGIIRFIGASPTEPVGHGNVQFRLERGMVVIDHFKYVNRSTEILLDGVVENIARGMQSSIKFNALATVRPFKGIPIIGTGDIDRMIRGFESGWSSVRVSGTLETPEIRGASFAETAATIKKLLSDQEQQQQQ